MQNPYDMHGMSRSTKVASLNSPRRIAALSISMVSGDLLSVDDRGIVTRFVCVAGVDGFGMEPVRHAMSGLSLTGGWGGVNDTNGKEDYYLSWRR